MKIFIAGATGVLGRALLPLLLQKGYSVRALARTAEKVRALEQAGVEAIEGELLAQETAEKLPAIMQGCTTAVHIATAIPRDMRAPGAWDTNTRLRTEGSRLLLQAAQAAGVQRYVQQSIVMAYADGGEQWLDESAPLDRSPARAIICAPVIAMENMVRAVTPARLQWCILRGGNFVGPGTAESDLIARLRAGQIVVRCDGRNFLSLVHVADMARAVCMALESAPASSVFNIVDEPLRNGDYMDLLARLVGAPQPARDATKPCPPSYRCSNQAAGTVLGWMPVHGIWPTEQQIAT
jgi:nucleoside-diphosphate-sugar epimerase